MTTKYQVSNVFSYKESGVNLTWQRDKKVLKTLNKNRVKWKQFDNQGVLRGIKDRVGWDKNWFRYINSSVVINKFSKTSFKIEKSIYDFTIEKIPELKIYPKEFQPAGQEFAIKYLNSFINERGKNYGKNISYPEKSRISCGRLSTYLSWGNISLRYVYQLVKKSDTYKFHKRSFDTFLARLNNFITSTFNKIAVSRTRQALISLDDRTLADIGYTRQQVLNGDFFNITDVVDFPAGNLGLNKAVEQDNKIDDKKAA